MPLIRVGKIRGYGPKMPYYDYEKIFWRIAEVSDYLEEFIGVRLRGYIHHYEPPIFEDFTDIPNLELKIGQVLFDIYDVKRAKKGSDISIKDIDISSKISDKFQPLISRGPRPASLTSNDDKKEGFEEIQAKNMHKANEDHEKRLHYLQKEKAQKTRARIQKQKKQLTANRGVRVDEVFKDKLKQKTSVPKPEWFLEEMMDEDLHDAKADSNSVLFDETIIQTTCEQENIEEKKANKEVRSDDWGNDVVVFDSDMEEFSLPKTTKTTRSLSTADSNCQIWSERLNQTTIARALWQKEDSMLVKRPPQFEMVEEEQEARWVPPRFETSIPVITGYQRQPAFKLWIEEHDMKIAAGGIPLREEFINDGLMRRGCGDEEEIIYYGQKYGKEWDKLYGPKREYVYAERALRKPDVRLQSWQKMKDRREWLHTRQQLHSDKVNQERLDHLDRIKAEDKERHRKAREKETLDQERYRLKKQRLINQHNRDQKKLDRGESLKHRLTPEERKKARRDADRLRKQNKKAEKTVPEEQNGEELEPC